MDKSRPPRATCCRCGGERTGRHSGYCRTCWAAYMRERKQGLHVPPEPRQCRQCGETYQPQRRIRSWYCSRTCKYRAKSTRPSVRACAHCGEDFTPSRVDHFLCSRPCSAAAHRLQSKFRSRVGEPTRPGVWRAVIAERDDWRCGICGESVDRSAQYPDPGYGTLDHVIPVTRGGTNDLANLRLAHMHCNRSRGNRMEAHASV